jgi:hypothetical protein
MTFRSFVEEVAKCVFSTSFDTGNEGDYIETRLSFLKWQGRVCWLFFIWSVGLILAMTATRCANMRYRPLQVTCHGPTHIVVFSQQGFLRSR